MTTEFWCHLSHVPLRAEPSDRAECVNEVLAGEKVQIRQKGRGHWVQVALPDGYMGWMDDRQLRPVTKEWMGQT
ncbi:MAG: SH3 domain-containing protein, partial [Flavobacteriales bacterium]|nr:SH3 domain-containing protein [Flavobacteriales bacterium]